MTLQSTPFNDISTEHVCSIMNFNTHDLCQKILNIFPFFENKRYLSFYPSCFSHGVWSWKRSSSELWWLCSPWWSPYSSRNMALQQHHDNHSIANSSIAGGHYTTEPGQYYDSATQQWHPYGYGPAYQATPPAPYVLTPHAIPTSAPATAPPHVITPATLTTAHLHIHQHHLQQL